MNLTRLSTAALLAATCAAPGLAQDAPPAGPAHTAESRLEQPPQDGPQRGGVMVDGQGNIVVLDENGQPIDGIQVQPRPEGEQRIERIAVPVPGGQPGQNVVIIRSIEIDDDGNMIVRDENGDIVDEAPAIRPLPGDVNDRVFIQRFAKPDVLDQAPVDVETIRATYLGVNCEPLDAETALLLMVDEGTGLNVGFVAPDSPAAAAGLKPGDVILKLNDQILVNPEQLAVLIRTHDEGEKVQLLVLRDGEELTLQATLTTSMLPPLGPGGRNLNQMWRIEQPMPRNFHAAPALPLAPENLQQHMQEIEQRFRMQQEQMLRMIEQIDRRDLDGPKFQQDVLRQIQLQLGQPGQGIAIGQNHFNIAMNDGQHAISIKGTPDGPRALTIKDKQGNILYDGELPQTDEQWDAVPEEARGKAQQLLNMNRIEMHIEAGPPQPAAPAEPAEPLPQA